MIDLCSIRMVYALGLPGGSELLIILAIVLVLFGGNKIPQLGDSLGKGIQNFRRSFQKEEETAEVVEAEVVPSTESNNPPQNNGQIEDQSQQG